MSGRTDPAGRTRRVLSYLRLKPFDTATAMGRAAERNRRAAWSTVAAVGARILALVISFITIPLALGYLGPERYGLWITIGAMATMLTFADFGLGQGLMNTLATASGRGDRAAAQSAVSSAFVMVGAIAVAGTALFAVAYSHVPWAAVANVSGQTAVDEAGPTVLVFVLCFALNVPLGLVLRIQYGYQEAFAASVWTAFGSLLSLAGLIVAISLRGSLPLLVLALAGGPVVAAALNALVMFAGRHRDLRPKFRLATRRVALSLIRVGVLFFILQISVTVASRSDVVVAARVLSPEAAAEYSVALRLFFLAPTTLAMAMLPLWPAYAEAITRGDIAWVRSTLIRSTLIGVGISSASSAVLIVFGRDLLRVWVGPVFDPPFMMLVGMAIWAVVSTAFTSISMLLNGATVVKFQIIVSSIMAIASIGASIVLAGAFGLSGVIWGTLLAFVVIAAGPTLWYLPRLFRQLASGSADRTAPTDQSVRM